MKLIDTNILIRFVTNDPPEQARTVQTLVQQAGRGELAVTDAVLAEMCQVLEFNAAYRLNRQVIAQALRGLLQANAFSFSPLAEQAIKYYALHAKLDCVDCLLLAQAKLSGNEVVSFDRRLLKVLATLTG